ncbi:hypothetical protein BURKHO8Y_200101 [Burkholderia sp. 8Y]|nr:hypothetical protein BURKHO8Y_200101 [Burkholderia sp. 8Y]
MRRRIADGPARRNFIRKQRITRFHSREPVVRVVGRRFRRASAVRRHRMQNRRHRDEGKPESGRCHRPRVRDQHEHERPREHERGRRPPPADKPDGEHRQRPQGALRGHVEARERGIQRRERRRAERRHLRRRHEKRRGHAAPPDPPPQEAADERRESRDEADMQARDRNEMTRAGRAQGRPVGVAHGILRAHGERDDDAAMRRVREHRFDALPNALAPAIDGEPRADGIAAKTSRRYARGHRARRANAAFEQADFPVAQREIRVGVRALEPCGQRPALTGHERGQRSGGGRPQQPHDARKIAQARAVRFHFEEKARAFGLRLRQSAHEAGQLYIALLEFDRQVLLQAQFRAHGGIGEAACGGRNRESRDAPSPAHGATNARRDAEKSDTCRRATPAG